MQLIKKSTKKCGLFAPEKECINSYIYIFEKYFEKFGNHVESSKTITSNSIAIYSHTCAIDEDCSRCRRKGKTYKLEDDLSNPQQGMMSSSFFDFSEIQFCSRSDTIHFKNGNIFGNYCPKYNILSCVDITHYPGMEKTIESIFSEIEYFNILKKVKEVEKPAKNIKITLGADPEFETVHGGRVVCASRTEKYNLIVDGYTCIGVDGSGDQRELRIPHSTTPRGFVNNLRKLFEETHGIEELSVKGNKYTLGGHLHIGGIKSDSVYIRLLDYFFTPFDDLNGTVRKKSGYGKKGDCRFPSYGIEYRTPPVGWLATPKLAMMTTTLAKRITHLYHNYKDIIIHEEYSPRHIRKDMRLLGLTDKWINEFFEEIKFVKNNSNKYISELWDIKEKSTKEFMK